MDWDYIKKQREADIQFLREAEELSFKKFLEREAEEKKTRDLLKERYGRSSSLDKYEKISRAIEEKEREEKASVTELLKRAIKKTSDEMIEEERKKKWTVAVDAEGYVKGFGIDYTEMIQQPEGDNKLPVTSAEKTDVPKTDSDIVGSW